MPSSQPQHENDLSASRPGIDPQTPISTSRKGILKSSPASVADWVDSKSNIDIQLVMIECLAFPGLARLSYRSTPCMEQLYEPEPMQPAEVANPETHVVAMLETFAEPSELGEQTQSRSRSSRPKPSQRKSITWDKETLDNEKPAHEFKSTSPKRFQSQSSPQFVNSPLKWDELSATMQDFVQKRARPEDGHPSNPYFPLRDYFICVTTPPDDFFEGEFVARALKHFDFAKETDVEDEISPQE